MAAAEPQLRMDNGLLVDDILYHNFVVMPRLAAAKAAELARPPYARAAYVRHEGWWAKLRRAIQRPFRTAAEE